MRGHLGRTNIANGRFLHIVILIVQDGIKEVDLSLKRVRAAVRYIRKDGPKKSSLRKLGGRKYEVQALSEA